MMREPYRTLFDGYESHWLLSHYLLGDEPDWYGLASEERLEGLSSGEQALLGIAGAFAGRSTALLHVDRRARFADLAILDNPHRVRVAQAILAGCEDW